MCLMSVQILCGAQWRTSSVLLDAIEVCPFKWVDATEFRNDKLNDAIFANGLFQNNNSKYGYSGARNNLNKMKNLLLLGDIIVW